MKKDLAEMRCLDLYLSGLSSKEYQKIKPFLKPKSDDKKIMPLLSWDIFSESYFKKLKKIRKVKDRREIEKLTKKFNWKNNIEEIFSQHSYQAIIITGLNQRIIWVNEGFTEMTGYSKSFAKNRKPSFLQGEKTSSQQKSRIAQALKKESPFREVIVNYRKDKSIYKCEVKIFPLYNNKMTHFIALEKEVF